MDLIHVLKGNGPNVFRTGKPRDAESHDKISAFQFSPLCGCYEAKLSICGIPQDPALRRVRDANTKHFIAGSTGMTLTCKSKATYYHFNIAHLCCT